MQKTFLNMLLLSTLGPLFFLSLFVNIHLSLLFSLPHDSAILLLYADLFLINVPHAPLSLRCVHRTPHSHEIYPLSDPERNLPFWRKAGRFRLRHIVPDMPDTVSVALSLIKVRTDAQKKTIESAMQRTIRDGLAPQKMPHLLLTQ
jgi:hypothetical protein